MYVGHRAQARREQRFGESLRDQLNRRIAQLDDQATRARLASVLVIVLLAGICPTAILLLGWRINEKSFSDDGYMIVCMIFMCVSVCGGRRLGTSAARHGTLLPRKRRLEALLKELDAP